MITGEYDAALRLLDPDNHLVLFIISIISTGNTFRVHKSDDFACNSSAIGKIDGVAVGRQGEGGVNACSRCGAKCCFNVSFNETLHIARAALLKCAYETNGDIMISKKNAFLPGYDGLCPTDRICIVRRVLILAGGKRHKYGTANNQK